MGINVKFFGSEKPGPGSKPVRVQNNVKLPFGKSNPVNWMTGKHIPLGPENSGKGVAGTNISYTQLVSLLEEFLKYAGDNVEFNNAINTIINKNEALASLFRFDMLKLEGEEILVWNGENWVNVSFRLRELFDVDIKTIPPEDGDVLSYDEETGKWTAKASTGGPAENPGSLIDVVGDDVEGPETALTDTWTAGGANGLAEWYVSRVVYNHAGDHKLYAFIRLRTYDRFGRLYSVSAETRIEVDAAEELV